MDDDAQAVPPLPGERDEERVAVRLVLVTLPGPAVAGQPQFDDGGVLLADAGGVEVQFHAPAIEAKGGDFGGVKDRVLPAPPIPTL